MLLDVCPHCNNPLINGVDGPLQIEYTEENLTKFDAGEISLAELNQTARFFYTRTRLCPNRGNGDTIIEDGVERFITPPCINFYGKDGGTIQSPYAVVETIKIYDE